MNTLNKSARICCVFVMPTGPCFKQFPPVFSFFPASGESFFSDFGGFYLDLRVLFE